MTISRFMAFLACGAMLALGACSNSRTVATDALDDDAHEEEHREGRGRAGAGHGARWACFAPLWRTPRRRWRRLGVRGANARADAVKALTKVEADLEVLQSGLTALRRQPRQDGGHRGG